MFFSLSLSWKRSREGETVNVEVLEKEEKKKKGGEEKNGVRDE